MRSCFTSLFVLAAINSSFAQHDSIFPIPRINHIVFDGVVDDKDWLNILPVPLIQYAPDPGLPPTEKTEIRFAYDDKYFYASICAYDSDPDGIRANSLYRDRLAGSDHLEILLDSYNDNESAFVFNVIPTGVRSDVAITNDATGGTISSGTWINRDFNSYWDAKVSRNERGWFAEMRIPFSSLRFQVIDGEVIMGLSVQRKIARKLERLVFPNISPTVDWAFLKPSLAQKIRFTGIKPSKPVYFTPYALYGFNQNPVLNPQGNAYQNLNDHQYELGADLKFSLSNNMIADITVNTDFAQAEADDQLVNLSRFSLFYPEKRQFFQERSGIFDFFTGGQSRLFFSRRIGISDKGEAIPILGGVRLAGRIKDWDIGFMDMQSDKHEELEAENFGVFRLKKRVLNENSYLGSMLTTRYGIEGQGNLAFGIDGLLRLFGDDYLNFNWVQSRQKGGETLPGIADLSGNRLAVEINRRRRFGLGYNLGFIYSGKNYHPGIGFVDRSDFKYFTGSLSHTWLYPEGAGLFNQGLQLKWLSYFDNDSGDILSAQMDAEWSFSTRNQDNGSFSFNWNKENLTEPLYLSKEIAIPSGNYRFFRAEGTYTMAFEKLIRTGLALSTGTFYDGWLNSLSLSPSWFVSKHLELGLQYSFYNANFEERDQNLNIHVWRLRVGTAANIKLSANSFIQYNSDANLFTTNIRFRYNFREGNDLWVVFNEALNTDRSAFTPILPVSGGRSILIKYLHSLAL